MPSDRLSAFRSMREASENRTTVSVASARVLTLGAGRGGVDEVERLDADDEPRRREDHRGGDPCSLDTGRDGREAEEDDGENRELPVHGGSFSEAAQAGHLPIRRGTVPRCPSGTQTSRSTRRSCARS